MSLSLQANFVEQVNLVLPLAFNSSQNGAALRIVSLGSGSIGQITASGAAGILTWSLVNAPNWLSLDTSVAGQATLNFSLAKTSSDPYQFYIQCVDSVTAAYFPILLEVAEPFSIAESTGASTLTMLSYDSTVADVVINGVSLTGVTSDVYFITPSFLPSGLSAVTQANTSLKLRVSDPNNGNAAGGLTAYTTAPIAEQFTVQAYKPGTIYDSPLHPATAIFTLQSLAAKPGIIDTVVGCAYNSGGNFRLDAQVNFIQGQAQNFTYQWVVSGVAGSTSSGGGVNDAFLVWIPTATGNVTFTLNIKNTSGTIIDTKVVGPIPCAAVGSWNATSAVKIYTDSTYKTTPSGVAVSVTISTPAAELSSGEVITVTLATSGAGAVEAGESAVVLSNAGPLTLNAGTPAITLTATLPATAGFREKWFLHAAGANALSSPTRTGVAQIGLIASGLPTMVVALSGGASVTASTGGTVGPIALSSTYNSAAVTGASYELVGAPNGLYIASGGFLTGSVLVAPGTYTFQVVSSATGYSHSYLTVSLVVSTGLAPLTVSGLSSSIGTAADNQAFTVSWGITGDPTSLILQSDSSQHSVRNVLGNSEALVSDIGNGVFSVYGTGYLGNSYTQPILVVSSSVAPQSALPGAATIAVIDDNSLELSINWQPVMVSGTYSAYLGWNISLQEGTDTPVVNTVTGLESGGTSDSRNYVASVDLAAYSLNMQPLTSNPAAAVNGIYWPSSLAFPAILTLTMVTFSTLSPLLSQPVTITLNDSYQNASSWRVVYGDGTTTGWMPLTVRSVVKSFTVSGPQSVVIQTQTDYGSNTPPVKLRRQVTQAIFVSDQEFGSATNNSLTGTLGVGGTQGFEIISAENTTAAPPNPYAVVVRALVRDTVTNELKLMVAASRYSNASSLLNTAAMDVFPLAGRPHVTDLLDFAALLTTNSDTGSVPVAIATPVLPTLVVGKPMAPFQLQATGGSIPYNWFTDGLPYGLQMTLDGTISGTPLELGNTNIDFSVMDNSSPAFIDSVTLPIVVGSDLVISTASLPNATVLTPYSQVMTTSGGIPPYSWSVATGALPLGLNLDTDSGDISGVPVSYNSTTDFSKVFSVTIKVSDSVGAVAYSTYTMGLVAAALSMGNLDQPLIFANENFKLDIPIYGGKSPYTVAAFSDDGVLGSGLMIVNPDKVSLVAGVNPSVLTITTASQTLYPQSYPSDILVSLEATGGVSPYQFQIDGNLSTTLPGATVNGNILFGTPTTDDSYSASIKVIDAAGSSTSVTLTLTTQQKYNGAYLLRPVNVNLNGSTIPTDWTITPLSALPDAALGLSYAPSGGSYYGYAVFLSGTVHLTQTAGNAYPMSLEIIEGTLPTGMVFNSGNAFGNVTDFSGIWLINYSGGSAPSVLGSSSFVLEMSNIQEGDGSITTAVSRESITVTSGGGATTPVVVIPPPINVAVNLNTTPTWSYPLVAEGGTSPYSFTIASGTTLPSISLSTISAQPVVTCTATDPGTYLLNLKATDTNNVASPVVSVTVVLSQTLTEPIHVLANTIPSTLFAGRTIPASTYYVQSDIPANWTASGLPAGVTLSAASGTKVYLQGNPTATGSFTFTVTATSVTYGTTASQTFTLVVSNRTATVTSPTGIAIVGVKYRAINNNSILSVNYVGYQPTDVDIPLLTASVGTVGSPSISSGGQPTTAVTNQTSTGFTMNYDYSCSTQGSDTITLAYESTVFSTLTLAINYATLVATGITSNPTISEYTTSGTFTAPVQITGGLAPYTVSLTGFGDSRFTASGSAIAVTTSSFVAGNTYLCTVNMTVTDSSGQGASCTGSLQLTVKEETYDVVNYSNATWKVNVSSGTPFTSTIIPNQNQSVPQLGHTPYQYYIDSVSLPGPLIGKVVVSPTKRVLAIQFNNTATPISISDRDSSLGASGNFTAAAISSGTAPGAGSYVITLGLRVVDAQNISTSSTQTLTLVVS